jgi:hypothetical protein
MGELFSLLKMQKKQQQFFCFIAELGLPGKK